MAPICFLILISRAASGRNFVFNGHFYEESKLTSIKESRPFPLTEDDRTCFNLSDTLVLPFGEKTFCVKQFKSTERSENLAPLSIIPFFCRHSIEFNIMSLTHHT